MVFIGGWSSPAHLTKAELQKHVAKTMTAYGNAWRMAPEGIPTYTWDEPSHGGAGAGGDLCPECLDAYRQKHGEPLPKDRNDGTYYRYITIAEGEMMEAYKRLAAEWVRQDPRRSLRPYGVTNEGSGLQEHPLALSRCR